AGGPQPVKMGRFVVKSFAVAELLRTTAELRLRGTQPPPEQLIGLLRLLEGVEIGGIVAPYKDAGGTVTIDSLSASWGQFVGMVPTRINIGARIAGPVSPQDPALFQLLGSTDVRSLNVGLDLGATWDEAARTVTLAPAKIELGGLLKGSAR